MTIGRLLATLAFIAIALLIRFSCTVPDAYRALAALLAVPTGFYLFSHPVLGMFAVSEFGGVLAAGYAFLPFVMVAGLAVFPITAIEGAVFAAPLIAAVAVASLMEFQTLIWGDYIAALWLLSLIAVVATMAGMSQLHFMMALVIQASHDMLTKGFTRRSGEELLELQFRNAARADQPLSLVFVDIDDFKSINDNYGHEVGDRALQEVAQKLAGMLRRGDILVRWGGEEFVVVLPNTDVDGARVTLTRLRERGFGQRPDGKPMTASIGVAERTAEKTDNWADLVELADQRMYEAKRSGKDRVVMPNNEVLH